MPKDTQAEGMTLIRYLDIYPWTKDPNEICLNTRQHVVDPMPKDCVRLKVQIRIPAKWFQPDISGVATADVEESELHDGISRPEDIDSPVPLKAQG